jgi:hypothetical protein
MLAQEIPQRNASTDNDDVDLASPNIGEKILEGRSLE